MTTRWLGWMIAGACALAGCEYETIEPWDGEPIAEGIAAIEGTIDDDSGNQHSGAMAARGVGPAADGVALITVDSVVVAEAPVRDGRFRLDAPPIEGPFFVESRLGGEATGRVLVPLGAPGGALTPTMPISAETTAEAAAFAILHAAGEAVDPIALIASITHEMAATATPDALAAAAAAAQRTERAALAAGGCIGITVDSMVAARAGAFERLVIGLRAGHEAGVVWPDYHDGVTAGLEAVFGADAADRADAAAASGLALAEALRGQPGFDAAVTWAGEAATRSRQAVIAAHVAADAEARARSDAAFEGFFEALGRARSAADAQAAHDGLIEALAGDGASVMRALIAAEGMRGSTASATLASAAEITVDTRTALGAELDAARLGAVYASLRGEVKAAIDGRVGPMASPAFIDALAEVVLADVALPSPDLIELRAR